MSKFVVVLAFLLTLAIVETASAAPTFCVVDEDGVPVCVDNTYFDGPA
jgi:hypothetical protein